MSLGWQSESALLPSKAKPIIVDGKSMMGLKALLYNEERERQNGGSNRTGSRKVKDNDRNSYSRGSKYKGENRSIEKGDENISKEAEAMRALSAKSELYEQLLKGNTDLSSDLVDFSEKRFLSKDLEKKHTITNISVIPPPAPPSVPKPAHIVLDSFQTCSDTVESSSSTNHFSNPKSHGDSASQWNWSKGNEKGSSESRAEDSHMRGSSYEYSANNRQYFEEIARERALKKAIDEKVRLEAERSYSSSSMNGSAEGTELSEGARIKTQWEKALNSSSRSYLDEIHQAAMKQRVHVDGAAAGDNGNSSHIVGTSGQLKRSLKDERLELIRQKRSKASLS